MLVRRVCGGGYFNEYFFLLKNVCVCVCRVAVCDGRDKIGDNGGIVDVRVGKIKSACDARGKMEVEGGCVVVAKHQFNVMLRRRGIWE